MAIFSENGESQMQVEIGQEIFEKDWKNEDAAWVEQGL